jgi:hypothetical protein
MILSGPDDAVAARCVWYVVGRVCHINAETAPAVAT